MIEMKPISKSRNALYKVVILFIVAVVAYSNAMKELNRLQEFVGSVQQFTSAGREGLARVYAATKSPDESSESIRPEIRSIDEFRPSGLIATGGSIEIKELSRDSAESATRGEVAVLANKKARGREPNAVAIKLAEYPELLTLSASYPGHDSNKPNTCELGKGGQTNVANTDVRLKLLLNVPAGIELLRRAANGEIKFKLADRAIASDLPSISSSEIETDTFNELRRHVSDELEMAAEN